MPPTPPARKGIDIRRIGRFLIRDEDGAASIETVILMPLFLMILAAIVDATMIFYGQAQVLRVVQDANRAMSIGRLTSAEETAGFVRSALVDFGDALQATSVVDNGVVTTRVTVPARDMQILGTFEMFDGIVLTISAQHLLEI